MIGQNLSRYRVIEPLGKGGMGVVYRAHDPHLERDVALKLLPEGALADESSRIRFRREALALSRLSHPAIGTVFDFDSEDGLDFLVMEFVPGATLAARIANGPLEEREVLDLALQVAEALETAHEHDVVHRDLKPANVMVTPGGRVKVLDFGLAKFRAERSLAVPALTGPLTVLGTLPYMAPEQLMGNEVDGRADVYSFGALVYEMAVGRPPFVATAEAALMNEVLNRPPPPPRQIRPALSRELESLVLRSLDKDPARRPSAGDAAAELRRIMARDARPFTPRIESLAVLPLENLSGDPEQEYFADGMTEALIADLARIRALRVISRTSAMRYKGVRRPLPEIARELGADAVVEGSVIRIGDRVRVTVQLIDAATDRHLWAERYERDAADVLAIQSDVAQAIAREIQVQISQQERTRLAEARRVDPQAHEFYLKGRFLWNRRTVEALERAMELFRRAIERDPTYAPAFSGLADCYNILADNNRYPANEVLPLAKAAAQRALALDDELAEAHSSLALAMVSHDWDWAGGEREYRRAIELDRGYPTAHQWYGALLVTLRRFDQGIEHSLEAVRRDPLSFILYSSAGDAFYYARRFDDAVDMYRRGIELEPFFGLSSMDLGRTLEAAGRFDESLAANTRGLSVTGADPATSSALACLSAARGDVAQARGILTAMRAKSEREFIPPYAFASVHARLGEVDEAIEALETAYRTRDRAMIYLDVNPRFDPLRPDARFQDLLRRMGFGG